MCCDRKTNREIILPVKPNIRRLFAGRATAETRQGQPGPVAAAFPSLVGLPVNDRLTLLCASPRLRSLPPIVPPPKGCYRSATEFIQNHGARRTLNLFTEPDLMLDTSKRRRFLLFLIKPSHYEDDGYVIQWVRPPCRPIRSPVSTASPGRHGGRAGREVDSRSWPSTRPTPASGRTASPARSPTAGGRGLVGFVGVQSNQFPRVMDCARPLARRAFRSRSAASMSRAVWRCSRKRRIR